MFFKRNWWETYCLCLALILVAVGIALATQVKPKKDIAVDPMAWAQSIWGDSAQIAQINRGNGWVYQVGCYIQTSTALPDFVIAGEGRSWKEAFESVDYSRNGESKFLVLPNGTKVPAPSGYRKYYQCNAGQGLKP